MKANYTIILFYKYIQITNPEKLQGEQTILCKKLGMKGRMIIAQEGINGTFEGSGESIDEYVKDLLAHSDFADVQLKRSNGTGKAFPQLSIKVREEIVATHLGEKDIDPTKVTGTYLMADTLHEWFESGKEFYIVDMRNDFEQAVGIFRNSIASGMGNFRDLPKVLDSLERLKHKTIVTVCTGGVRCEKASGFLLTNGFTQVYQLYGGIVTYMEKYPGEDFLGSLYVFDNRLVMGFNMEDPKREIVGRCIVCKNPSEHFINCTDGFCHRHFIVCEKCLAGEKSIYCPMGCRDYAIEHPEIRSESAITS